MDFLGVDNIYLLSFLITGMTKWVLPLKITPFIKKNKVRQHFFFLDSHLSNWKYDHAELQAGMHSDQILVE